MDNLDRRIINELQGGFPVCERPFREAAQRLGTSESELITRLRCMLDDGLLSRFGPLFNAEQLGGALSLCAMKVPRERFDAVAEKVNAFAQVAHNYQRDHEMNMWFVLATGSAAELEAAIHAIERETGLKVFNLPKQEEFFVSLHFQV
ncbi:MAG: AsnC family transcriptional regulator [Gammaproteobacteria bacterium]|jgi:DNA-binding Lrp family transcriptional regulator